MNVVESTYFLKNWPLNHTKNTIPMCILYQSNSYFKLYSELITITLWRCGSFKLKYADIKKNQINVLFFFNENKK